MKHTSLIQLSKQTIGLLVIFLILVVAGIGIAIANRIELERVSKGLTINVEDVTFSHTQIAPEVIGTVEDRIGYTPKVQPPLNGRPEHIKFIFPGEQFQNDPYPQTPQLYVLPRDRYKGLYQADQLAEYESIISQIETAISIGDATIMGEIPILPPSAEQQLLHAKEAVIPFNGGTGIRFIAQYGKTGDVIQPIEFAYVYQGRTEDKKYHVSFFFPININDELITTDDISQEEQLQIETPLGYKEYIEQARNEIQALPQTAFSPTLELTDQVIRSLTIDEGI